jgi:hypothetical protein
MKIRFALLAAACLFSGCASAPDSPGSVTGLVGGVTDAVSPGARDEYRAKQDDTKCRDYGYQPQTKGYADCRMELERLRAGSAPVTVHVR